MMQDQGETRHMLLPIFIGAAVLMLSLTLLTIIARSPYTQANLDAGFDSGYSRTIQAFVGAPIPLVEERMAMPSNNDPVQHGKQLFVTEGCASCHGLDGRGGVVGPPIVSTKASKLRTKTQAGPRGMPAYAPGALSDDDLAAIAAYLKAMNK